jgi:hypothetical protein
MTHRLHLFAFLSCLPLVVGRLNADTADNETTRVLLNLQRAALSELLRSSPPKRLFTLALAYDRSSKTFEPLPEAMQKELLNTMGANKKLFVEPSQLNLPSDDQLRKNADGSTVLAGVTKKGTVDLVAIYRVYSFEWRPEGKVVVNWSVSSGGLSGYGGSDLMTYADGKWRFEKRLKSVDY